LREEWQLDVPLKAMVEASDSIDDDDIVARVVQAADEAFAAKLEQVGSEQFTPFMRMVLLQSIDSHWREAPGGVDYLRQGIHLRGYAQKNPKQEYTARGLRAVLAVAHVVKRNHAGAITVRIQTQERWEAAEAIEEKASQVSNVTIPTPKRDGSVSQEPDLATLAQAVPRVGPRRPLPLRQRQEVQDCPRQVA